MEKINRAWIKIVMFLMGLLTTVAAWSGQLGKEGPDVVICISPLASQQQVNGFGTSACWWSQMVEDDATRTDIISRLYGRDGLRLNIYRYNVGGGVNPAHNRVGDPWRNTESFYVFNEETQTWGYDFTRDANAQKALFEALSLGCVDTVVLFANSPHYSMTVSGEASGGFTDYAPNLDPAHEQDFVDYFLTITEYFLSKGVPVKYISPINEPQWSWGGAWVGQEGCHYEPEQLARVLRLFAEGIERRGLPVQLSVPEAGEISDLTRTYFDLIGGDEVTLRNTGSFAYHSYWRDVQLQDKANFRTWFDEQPYGDRTLDMTEWCELPNRHATTDPMAAVLMARVIANDFNFTRANSWTSWVAVNGRGINAEDGLDYSDGLFSADADFATYDRSYRYEALGHFSRFIPAGSKILLFTSKPDEYGEASWERRVETDFAAFLTPQGKQVLVISNEGGEKTIRLAASGLHMQIFTTDAEHRLEKTYDGRRLRTVEIPACSVTTIVVDNDLKGVFQ